MLKISIGNKRSIKITPKLTFNVLIKYERNRAEILDCTSSEERFRMISFPMVMKTNETPITYSEYRTIRTSDLINIAETLLKTDASLLDEFCTTNPNEDFFQRVNKSIDSLFNDSKKRIVESLKPVFETIQDSYRSIDFEAIKKTLIIIGEQVSIFSKNIQSVFPKELFESLKRYADEVDDSVLNIKIAMIESGWINAIELQEEDILEMLVVLQEEEEPDFSRTVNDFMVKLYTEENINNILLGWKKKQWLEKRYFILNSTINAHLREDYVLSVPVLLAQFEGIIRDVVPHNHKGSNLNNFDIRIYLKRMHEKYERINLSEIFDQYLKKNIHSSFTTGESLNSDLSRNAILHGADTEYGNIVNSLKIICLFDYVQKILSKNFNLD